MQTFFRALVLQCAPVHLTLQVQVLNFFVAFTDKISATVSCQYIVEKLRRKIYSLKTQVTIEFLLSCTGSFVLFSRRQKHVTVTFKFSSVINAENIAFTSIAA